MDSRFRGNDDMRRAASRLKLIRRQNGEPDTVDCSKDLSVSIKTERCCALGRFGLLCRKLHQSRASGFLVLSARELQKNHVPEDAQHLHTQRPKSKSARSSGTEDIRPRAAAGNSAALRNGCRQPWPYMRFSTIQ